MRADKDSTARLRLVGGRESQMLEIPDDALRVAAAATSPVTVDLPFRSGNVMLHARLTTRPGARTVLVLFHGALDRQTRKPPTFITPSKTLMAAAHCLSIADPSILRHPRLAISWYAGDQNCDTQGLVSEIIRSVSEVLGVSRRIYHGTSGGGFAALAFSHGDPDSVAVVGSPQTNIESYYALAIERYRKAAWPDLAEGRPLSDVITSDLCKVYAAGFSNTVIYVQSIGDRHHYLKHALPFCAAIAGTKAAGRFFLHSDFWGRAGHVTEPREYVFWIKAATMLDDLDPEKLLKTRFRVESSVNRLQAAKGEAAAKPKTFAAADLEIHALLAELRKRKES